MSDLKYRYLPKGYLGGYLNPLNIAMIDKDDILAAGATYKDAVKAIAQQVNEPVCIDIIDNNAVTTTTDGLMVEGPFVVIAAGDNGFVNEKYGYVPMVEIPYSDDRVDRIPPLEIWNKLHKGKKMYGGPDPEFKKNGPFNLACTGRACNCNSGSELFDLITMKEMLFTHLGMRALYMGQDAMVGKAGELLSVAIGMFIPEEDGRICKVPMAEGGDTLHRCGSHSKTLKRDLPIVVCKKRVLAEYVLRELDQGMTVGYHLSVSPANIMIAKLAGFDVLVDRITDSAWAELNTIGFTREYIESIQPLASRQELLDRADELIPGLVDPVVVKAEDVMQDRIVTL